MAEEVQRTKFVPRSEYKLGRGYRMAAPEFQTFARFNELGGKRILPGDTGYEDAPFEEVFLINESAFERPAPEKYRGNKRSD